ncbi:hypothetical protein K3495_g1276 [Podosphaera aphanis]|nr:hypothetical protein K3495_g1276 [Podosphaera aphanis]
MVMFTTRIGPTAWRDVVKATHQLVSDLTTSPIEVLTVKTFDMDIDEDDDFYAPEETILELKTEPDKPETYPEAKTEQDDGGLEEGEEEDDGDEDDSGDSDIDIITERKDGNKTTLTTHSKYADTRNISQRNASNQVSIKPTSSKKVFTKSTTPQVSSAELPGIATSKIDVDAKPIYEPAGKRITQLNIDEDLPDNEKPWRRPGTDITDYFNYGFDEFTWALYASKQEAVRSEYSADKIALNSKKLFEDMNMMMAMGAMPPMVPSAPATGQMPGMEGMDMQAMLQQMVAAGVDPTQMDSTALFAVMQGNPGTAGGSAGNQGGNQVQGFGAQVNFGQTQNQYGFDQGIANANDNRNRGGNFGRGRGRRGW